MPPLPPRRRPQRSSRRPSRVPSGPRPPARPSPTRADQATGGAVTAFRTRGHPAAVTAVAAMLRGHVPHAILLVGPRGIGKRTLAGDIAAGLLCTAPDPA